MADVINTQLEFNSLFGQHPRTAHYASVVDQYVQFLLFSSEVFDELANRFEVCEVTLSAANVCVLRLVDNVQASLENRQENLKITVTLGLD